MSTNEQLSSLIQKAASEVVMMAPGSGEDVSSVNDIFEQIAKDLGDITEIPEQIKNQAIDAAGSAKGKVTQIVSGDGDSAQTLSEVSSTVESLQSLIEQVCKGVDVGEIDVTFAGVDAEQGSEAEAGSSSESNPEASSDETESSESEASDSDSLIIPEEDAPLVLDFASEAMEHIETAESALLELENNPDDTESINSIFRGFHTVKGMAGFLNLQEIGTLAHSAENLLDMARNDKIVLVGNNMDVVFDALDMLKKMITNLNECVESGSPVLCHPGLDQMVARIKACQEGETAEAASDVADSEPAAKNGQAEESQEAVSEVENSTEADGCEIQSETVADTQAEPDSKPEVAQQAKAAVTKDTKAEKAGESGSVAKTNQAASGAKSAQKGVSSEEKIKVSMDRLDKLVNMVGEIVIAQSMVAQEAVNALAPEHQLNEHISNQGKIVRELQELSMMMRMVPIQGVFQKMARLVRDLSRKTGKKVDFVTVGEETELDRVVVDQIADPLVHMVRNSVDHGIESDEERSAAGKTEPGKVELRAYHQAGNIVIEIEDNGRGLAKDKILQKAIERGIVGENDDLTDQEIFKLIFHPGFSTADKITDVSGRGVGMDVVKKNIDSLRGKIDIFSEQGKGSIFTIRLPLTLAIIDGQLARIGNETYIVPIVSIHSCLKATDEQISTIRGKVEMVQVHGEMLPVVRLHSLFGLEADYTNASEASLVVVEDEGRKGCLMVDEVLGQQQVVIKSLGGGIGRVKGLAGGAILGNGRVSLILDVAGILEVAWD